MPPMIPANSSQLFDTPIFNAQVPKEGPRGMGIVAPFTNTAIEFDINLLLTQSQQFMSLVQAFFCDNSLNGSSVTIRTGTLNQSVIIPANSQAYLPLLVAKNDTITVSSMGEVPVTFVFLNVPVAAAVWAV